MKNFGRYLQKRCCHSSKEYNSTKELDIVHLLYGWQPFQPIFLERNNFTTLEVTVDAKYLLLIVFQR